MNAAYTEDSMGLQSSSESISPVFSTVTPAESVQSLTPQEEWSMEKWMNTEMFADQGRGRLEDPQAGLLFYSDLEAVTEEPPRPVQTVVQPTQRAVQTVPPMQQIPVQQPIEPQESQEISVQSLLKCFAILKTNYLNLCDTYNQLLQRYSESQAEVANLKSQTLEQKAMLDSLLHEINVLRAKERRRNRREQPAAPYTQNMNINLY